MQNIWHVRRNVKLQTNQQRTYCTYRGICSFQRAKTGFRAKQKGLDTKKAKNAY